MYIYKKLIPINNFSYEQIRHKKRIVTNIDRAISNSEEAKQFLVDLFNNGEDYHPEDDAMDIIRFGTGEPLFTKKEAKKVNSLMEDVYKHADFDPCEIILNLMNK